MTVNKPYFFYFLFSLFVLFPPPPVPIYFPFLPFFFPPHFLSRPPNAWIAFPGPSLALPSGFSLENLTAI